MEAEWIAKRATLRWLLHTHAEWTQQAYAAFLHCSVGWVKKWKKRLQEVPPDDLWLLDGGFFPSFRPCAPDP